MEELPINIEEYNKYKVRLEPPADMAPNPGTPEYKKWFEDLKNKLGDIQ